VRWRQQIAQGHPWRRGRLGRSRLLLLGADGSSSRTTSWPWNRWPP